mgnify:CR=1 FL=1
MATYEEIYGKRVKEFDSDPTLESSYEGQVWYDKATGVVKSVVAFASWTSASPMISAKTDGGSLPGSPSTYGLAGGGSTNGSWTGVVNNTFSWNGSGWASEPNMNVARNSVRGDGTSTSALFVGGIRPPAATYSNEVESWNGSSWTAETAYPQAINQTSVAGTETAAVSAGGYDYVAAPSTGGRTRETFEYDGSSWTAQNNKPFGASNMGSAGTQTASIFFGGFGQPGDGTAPASPSSNPLSSAEEYDGTNWTTAASLNVAKYGITGSGNQTDAGGVGGHPYLNTFERYDGSSWTQSATLATGRTTSFSGGLPASTDGSFVGGGKTPTVVSSTETFVNSINTITAAAWASGNNLGTGRYGAGAGGQTHSDNFIFGGLSGAPAMDDTEEYNGSSWTAGGDYPTPTYYAEGFGTQTAGLAAGGYPNLTTSCEYDGSSWTAGNSMNTGRYSGAGCGIQTSSLFIGGFITSGAGRVANVESYDGTSWSEGPDLGSVSYQASASGNTTAAMRFGGTNSSGGGPFIPRGSKTSEEWDGSSWTAGPTMVLESYAGGSSLASATDAIIFGGFTSASPDASGDTLTQGWNGTAFSTRPSQATIHFKYKGSGSGTAALSAGGRDTPSTFSNSTEEFTGETTAVTASTLTSS